MRLPLPQGVIESLHMSGTTGLLTVPVWWNNGFIDWVHICVEDSILLVEAIYTFPQELPTIFTAVASS